MSYKRKWQEEDAKTEVVETENTDTEKEVVQKVVQEIVQKVIQEAEAPIDPNTGYPPRSANPIPRAPRLSDFLTDGQQIRYRTEYYGELIGKYDLALNKIVCENGATAKTLSGFASLFIKSIDPECTPNNKYWTRCEVDVDGIWVKADGLQVIV